MSLLDNITEQLADYARLMRIDRPIGSYLLLWPTLWALWIAAEGFPQPKLLIIFTLCVFLMRAAGCIVNDLVDRNIDPHVVRTAERPLAQGRVSILEAVSLALGLFLISLILVLQTNMLTVLLAVVALILAVIYPLMKRYTYLPQVILGAAFSMSIPMAFAAQTGSVPSIAWLVFSANLIWTVAYDTFYAMVDREHDLKIEVKSSAILFGNYDILAIGLLQALTLIALILVGLNQHLGNWYGGSLLVATGLFGYQLWIARNKETGPCFAAFLNNQWVGLAIFLGIMLDYAYH